MFRVCLRNYVMNIVFVVRYSLLLCFLNIEKVVSVVEYLLLLMYGFRDIVDFVIKNSISC